jgi:divalent metal cation (Fe/Co/Zn/Cd) transporter
MESVLEATQLDVRVRTARRGRHLEIITVIWGTLEAGIALTAAMQDKSISLTGFGLDSLIEVISAVALLWRMSHEMNHHRRHHAERISLKVAGCCLLALGVYVALDGGYGLWKGHSAETGWLGMGVTAAALVCMPMLAAAKRKVGRALSSSAMMTDAQQTDFCMYQAAIVLFGLLVHRIFGIGWADSAAALLLVPVLVRAGILSLQGKQCCNH